MTADHRRGIGGEKPSDLGHHVFQNNDKFKAKFLLLDKSNKTLQ